MSDSQENIPLPVLLEHLNWNLQRFKEMLDQEPTPYFRDAALQRFEFSMTSVLKCIAAASGKNEEDKPADLLKHASNENWFPQDTDCASILKSIEDLKPESREDTAEDVYQNLSKFYKSFEHLYRLHKNSITP